MKKNYFKPMLFGVLAFMAATIIFYSCKRESNDHNASKNHFETIMSSDEDIKGMLTELSKIGAIHKHNGRMNLSFALNSKNISTFAVNSKRLQIEKANSFVEKFNKDTSFQKSQLSSIKSYSDLEQFMMKEGYGSDDSKQMSDSYKKNVEHFRSFIKKYPEFSTFTREKQKALIINGFNEIQNSGKGLFHPIQETNVESTCYAAYDKAYTDAQRANLNANIGFDIALLGCIAFTDGALFEPCLAAYFIAIGINEAATTTSLLFAGVDYQECVSH